MRALDTGSSPVVDVGSTAERALGRYWLLSAGAQLWASLGLHARAASFTTDAAVALSSQNFAFGLPSVYRASSDGRADRPAERLQLGMLGVKQLVNPLAIVELSGESAEVTGTFRLGRFLGVSRASRQGPFLRHHDRGRA
jgi:hypothetical protein